MRCTSYLLCYGCGSRFKGQSETAAISSDTLLAPLYNTVKRMYKNPYHVITTETLGKLAKALGVPPGELIEEVPDETSTSSP